MEHSQVCTNLVASEEGFSSVAYQDQNGVWTLGNGRAIGIKPGQTCTREEAWGWLDIDLHNADLALERYVHVPLRQQEWDALASFVYNIGGGNFAISTARKLINAKAEPSAITAAMMMWDSVDGKVNQGLINRRKREVALYLTGSSEGVS